MYVHSICVCVTAKSLTAYLIILWDVYDSCDSHGDTLQVASDMNHQFGVDHFAYVPYEHDSKNLTRDFEHNR